MCRSLSRVKKWLSVIDNKAAYISISALIYICVFCLMGERGYVLWKDSPAYLAFDGRSGIVPLYPLFLRINKLIFGEAVFLYMVVAEQTIIAVVCIVAFTEFIRRRFHLSYLASYPVVLFAAFMPFTTNYPLSISNHDIMTEALAYPFFYLYMICFLKSIFDKKYRDVVMMVLVSTVLALTRTQLQLVGVFNAAALFYMLWMKGRNDSIKKQIGRAIVNLFLSGLIIVVGEVLFLGANAMGQSCIASMNQALQPADEGESKASAVEEEEMSKTDEAAVSVGNVTNQYGHLIIDKAIYEIEEEDYLLFEDEQMQELCKAIYQEADDRQRRYVYARDGLWMWEDIMEGIGSGTHVTEEAWRVYCSENPDTILTYSAVNQIALVLLKEHFGRVVYHMLCMMPQGFICTVFFQKAEIYLLCHLITLFIYISAILLVIWAYRRKEIPRRYPEFLLGCIVINVFFVLIQSIMFFAIQRYLVYCFGIFYIAYYLLFVKALQQFVVKLKKDGIYCQKPEEMEV